MMGRNGYMYVCRIACTGKGIAGGGCHPGRVVEEGGRADRGRQKRERARRPGGSIRTKIARLGLLRCGESKVPDLVSCPRQVSKFPHAIWKADAG